MVISDIVDTIGGLKLKKWFLMVVFLVGCLFVANYAEANVPVQYDREVIELAQKVSALKEKHQLEYKSEEDLLDTCSKIVKYCKYEKVFNKYDLASIAIKESRFNPRAWNKVERVAGLMQITKPRKYWKEELFWFTNPYDKDQNIKAALVILKTFYKERDTKRYAIKRYNGTGSRAEHYVNDLFAIKEQLRSVKV